MGLLHDNVCAGHLGMSRTIVHVRARFYWVGYKQDIINKCNTCHVYQAPKMPVKQSKAPLKPCIVGIPMERIQIDLITPFPETYAGNKHILTVTCCFTKWTESYPLKNITVKKCHVEVSRTIHMSLGCAQNHSFGSRRPVPVTALPRNVLVRNRKNSNYGFSPVQ